MKTIRKVYAFFSYMFFFLLTYSVLLNVISLAITFFSGNVFTVAYWELLFVPVLIVLEIIFYQPVYPKFLKPDQS